MTLNRRRAVPLWLLGLFTFSGPVGMHIFVPALPAAVKDLHATPAALELTISLYILGLAVGQLVYGPASDRFGRRPVLLVGLSIFTIASIAALFAPDTHTLILARFFQAVGGCSGLVLARAIIRDTSQAQAPRYTPARELRNLRFRGRRESARSEERASPRPARRPP